MEIPDSRTFLGRLLRLPLRAVPRGACVPILQGRLRGTRWYVGSGNHGYWLGVYESAKRRVFERLIVPGDVVWDVGAHVGWYTLLASRLVGSEGRVFSFEPFPANLRWLHAHLERNGVANVQVVPAAAWNENDELAFAAGTSTSTGKVSSHGEIKVDAVVLDDLVRSGQVKPPALIKMDIEGAEVEALEGLDETLRTHRPTILLATHGPDIHARVCRRLSAIGYHVEGLDGLNAESTDELIAIAPLNMREAQPSDGMDPHEATGPIPQDGRS